jgi:hypothetical protein
MKAAVSAEAPPRDFFWSANVDPFDTSRESYSDISREANISRDPDISREANVTPVGAFVPNLNISGERSTTQDITSNLYSNFSGLLDMPELEPINPTKKSKCQRCCLHDIQTDVAKKSDLVKGPHSAWVIYTKQNRQPGETPWAAHKRLATTWHNLSEEEHEHYRNLAQKDLHRYESDVKRLNMDERKLYKKLIDKKKKKPHVPRLSGYGVFVSKNHPILAKEHPEYGFREMGKALGYHWGQLSKEEKAMYTDQASTLKSRMQKKKKVREDL